MAARTVRGEFGHLSYPRGPAVGTVSKLFLKGKLRMKQSEAQKNARIENIYQLDGRVPVGKAIPFGLQHVLAMFVSNVAPIILVASVALYDG